MYTHLLHRVRPIAVALLFGLALFASLFFNGVRIEFFAVAMGLLLLLLLSAFWRGYALGLKIPKTPLAIALSLFWAWLAITQLWSPVPYVSMVNFWWVGSACLVFWLMSLDPDRERILPLSSALVLAIGFALAVVSLYQLLVSSADPHGTFLTHNTHAAFLGLVTIPATRHFLAAPGGPPLSRSALWVWGLVLFVLVLAIAVTGSRGMAVGLLAGLGVVIAIARRDTPASRLIALCSIVVVAYVAANILVGSSVVSDRLVSIFKPAQSGLERFLIWREAWRMLMDAPWWGIGLGTYWLHWPPYRHPDDESAGFYVHNDYLQIWIETGLPGLLLLLAVYFAVIVTFVRLLRHAKADSAITIEAAGLFGGLLAIAAHTFFDFDFYIHPIQLVMGLALARIHALYLSYAPVKSVLVEPAQFSGRRAYRLISVLLVTLPLLYFAALGMSAVLTNRALGLAAKGKWLEASNALSHAARLMPMSDLVLTSHADLFRQAIGQLPRAATERAALYREALALLEDAEKANPLRPQVFFIRAMLYQQNADLAGPEWVTNAERAYAAALKLDPLAYRAREAYARFLLAQERPQQAREVLEGGITYKYPGKAVVGYYLLAAEVRRQQGDAEGTAALTRKASDLVGRPLSLPAPVPERFPQQQHLK